MKVSLAANSGMALDKDRATPPRIPIQDKISQAKISGKCRQNWRRPSLTLSATGSC
jgi:hypothetical protein